MQHLQKHPDARYALVDLTPQVVETIADHPAPALRGLTNASSDAPIDLIHEGDSLEVSVFEASESGLFSHIKDSGGSDSEPSTSPEVGSVQTFPRLVVDRDGLVNIPYAGSLRMAGLTPSQAAEQIRRALAGKAIQPQVTLSVGESPANSVTVVGAVKNSGLYPLKPYDDHLLDMIAAAGGSSSHSATTATEPEDVLIVVRRQGLYAQDTLANILTDPSENVRLAPKDEVHVLDRPRKYDAFGALGQTQQVPMVDPTVTLANALARAYGLEDDTANAKSVLLFRFERPEVAAALGVTNPPTPKGVPIIYRLNLRAVGGFFIADEFDMAPDDIVYVARSDLTEAGKFLSFVNMVTNINYSVSTKAAVIP